MTAPGSGDDTRLWETREAAEAWRRLAAERSKYIAPATERMFAVAAPYEKWKTVQPVGASSYSVIPISRAGKSS